MRVGPKGARERCAPIEGWNVVSVPAPRRPGVAMLACLLLGVAVRGAAQPTTDHPASILFFPWVVADTGTDTIIQIGNSSNSSVSAQCFYVDGDTCGQTEFSIFLAKQQPTHWVASRGRPIDPNDAACSEASFDCDGAGLDPGDVPALPDGFHGLLFCVETDAAHEPLAGNHLSGEASLVGTTTSDVSQYTAVGLEGNIDSGDGDPYPVPGRWNDGRMSDRRRIRRLPRYVGGRLAPRRRHRPRRRRQRHGEHPLR